MGDRANIYLYDDRLADTEGALPPRTGMFLYTHWSGYRWPEALKDALIAGKERWGDEQYLARIIMSNVFMDSHDGTLGAGLSTRLGDNEYDLLCVNLLTSEVGVCDPKADPHNLNNWENVQPFSEFVAADVSWDSLARVSA